MTRLRKQFEWNNIDIVCEREAEALYRARKFNTHLKGHHNGILIMSQHQAVWDELLEVHFSRCSLCNRTLRDPSSESNHLDGVAIPQDFDICPYCIPLFDKLKRAIPARVSST